MYVKGDRNSTDYYRIYQYLDKLDGKDCKCVYRMQMVGTAYRKWMPVSGKPIYIKILVYLYIYFRRLRDLLCDCVNPPKILILHRGLIGRYMPYSFRFLLKNIVSRGTKLIWDYDDHIVANGEVSQVVFNEIARLSTHFFLTHEYLKSLLPLDCQQKAMILPTTDGDMYHLYTERLEKERLTLLQKEVILVWVATAGNIKFLESIIPILDETASLLYKLKNQKLILKVVCNIPLSCSCENLVVENIHWMRDRAIQEMLKSHIGIMPLIDSEIARGKGGFKLVQYLSIGLPCIGSDVGYNVSVISSDCGFLANCTDDWKEAILRLSDSSLWKSYSKSAFRRWKANFSYEKNLQIWRGFIINS